METETENLTAETAVAETEVSAAEESQIDTRPAEAQRTDLTGVGKPITEEQNVESTRKLELLCTAADEMKARVKPTCTAPSLKGETAIGTLTVRPGSGSWRMSSTRKRGVTS